MNFEDMLSPSEAPGQQPEPQSVLQQMLTRSKDLDARITELKNRPAPSMAEPVKDELEPVSMDLLRGFLSQNSVQGEVPSRETFDKMFRQSVSPGRELLANVLAGMSASFTGTKFRDVRSQAWDRDVETQKLNMEKQQLQRQAMQGVAQIALQLKEQRGREAMQRGINEIRTAQNENQRATAIAKLELDQQKFGFDVAKFMEEQKVKNYNAQDSGNALFDAARRMVEGRMADQGVDITSPKGQKLFWEATAEQWKNLYATQEKIQASNRPAPMPYIMQVQGPDGNSYAALIDKQNGQVVGGSFVGRKLTAAQLDSVNMVHNASSSLRNALMTAQNSPDAIGGFAQQLPPDLRARVGALKPEERNLRLFMNTAVASYIQSISGKAVTDSERKFLTEGLPKVYEKPENFFPAAYAFAGMLDAAAMRTQYGVDLDFVKPMQVYMSKMQEYIKKNGSAAGVPILSSEQFLNMALRYHGKTLKQGAFGTMEVVDASK